MNNKIFKRASAKWRAGTWLALGDRLPWDLVRADTRIFEFQGKNYLVYAAL